MVLSDHEEANTRLCLDVADYVQKESHNCNGQHSGQRCRRHPCGYIMVTETDAAWCLTLHYDNGSVCGQL